jgi:methionyl-tRNA formyltransferase
MRIVFMGTPMFSVGALEKLHQNGHEICLVVTQPDKPKGRGKTMQFSAVKDAALRLGLPVFQPKRIKEESAVEKLKEQKADIFVVAAFGQILTKEILDMPPYGCLNIHASLLPKYRGAAPIQWAILNGEKTTGITIMQMDQGLDTGDMLLKKELIISEEETADSLHDKLSVMGADLIVEAIEKLEQGTLKAIKQGESTTAYAKMLTKEMGAIAWSDSARKIHRLVRGMNSWPSAYTSYQGKKMKIWECNLLDTKADGKPGTISEVKKDSFIVNTGDGQISIVMVQLEGKKKMPVQSFLLGNKITQGEYLI